MEKLGAATLRLLFPRNSTLHDLSTAIWVQSNTHTRIKTIPVRAVSLEVEVTVGERRNVKFRSSRL